LIWEHTVEDRVIILDYDEKKGCYTTQCQAPAALHVNKESRAFAEKAIYRMVEFTKSRRLPIKYFFYNERSDTLYFRKFIVEHDVVKQQLFVTGLKYLLDQVAPMEMYIRPCFLSRRLAFAYQAMLQLLEVFIRDPKQWMAIFGVEKEQEIAIVGRRDRQLNHDDAAGKGLRDICANNPKLVLMLGCGVQVLHGKAEDFYWEWLKATSGEDSPQFIFTEMEIQYESCMTAGKGSSCSHNVFLDEVVDLERHHSERHGWDELWFLPYFD
jgi:hypothetical protein